MMRRTLTLLTCLALTTFLTACGATPTPSSSETSTSKVSDISPKVLDEQAFEGKSNLTFNSDGSFTIGDLKDVPQVYAGVKRYAFASSQPLQAPQTFQTAIIKLNETHNQAIDQLEVDASASADGTTWSEFLPVHPDTHEVTFQMPSRYLKFRIILLSNDLENPPVVKSVSVQVF